MGGCVPSLRPPLRRCRSSAARLLRGALVKLPRAARPASKESNMTSRKSSVFAAAGLTILSAGAARAQVQPPSPYELVSQLDFECRPAQGAPPAAQVFIRQLNPVLQNR